MRRRRLFRQPIFLPRIELLIFSFFSFASLQHRDFSAALPSPEIGLPSHPSITRRIQPRGTSLKNGRSHALPVDTDTHRHTHSPFCGILFSGCLWGEMLLPPMPSSRRARLCLYVDAGPFCRRPNPSCTHAFLSYGALPPRRCGLFESAPKTVDDRSLWVKRKWKKKRKTLAVPLKHSHCPPSPPI